MTDLIIRDCIEEILTGVITGIRPIIEGTLRSDPATGQTLYNQAVGAIVEPTFDVSIEYEPTEEQCQQPSPIWIEKINIVITTCYVLDSPVLDSSDYYLVKANSAIVGKKIRVALSWPGKLTYNDIGESTGIISGCLRHVSSLITKDRSPMAGIEPGLYITEHTFAGFVQSTELVV
jgi:hypothetical protein